MCYNYSEVSIMRDNTMKVVYDSDLEDLLKRFEVYDDVLAHRCHCVFCGSVISMENIDGIIPQGDRIAFSCNTPVCRKRLIEEMGAR